MRRSAFPASGLLLSCVLLAGCAGGEGVSRSDEVAAPVVVPSEAVEPVPAEPVTTPAAPSTVQDVPATSAQDADQTQADSTEADFTDPSQADPTQAELDFAAIYGGQPYDPVADPTLPAPVQLPESYDPWEPLNRRVHTLNNAVDRYIASPLAHAYVEVVPRPVRLGVRNFFGNLGQPVNALNSLLQGRPLEAGQAFARFLVNATLGIGGIFDPASDAHLRYSSEDFGQTLGKWGWRQSRYVELPLFGPRTVRDVFGLIGDAPLSPLRQVESDPPRIFLQGLQLVDVRTQLFAVDSMREGATDDYALVRDAWLQRRNYQIAGDQVKQDESLPEYLREDVNNPMVPVDAMPVLPGGD